MKGVGAKTAENLTKLNLYTLQDVLFHLPYRYEDRTKITKIAAAVPGDRILIEGAVQQVVVSGRGKVQMTCRLQDDTGVIMLRFFHFNGEQLRRFKEENVRLRCFGEVHANFYGALEMVHPEYQTLTAVTGHLELSDRLTPIYPTTLGVGQSLLRRLAQHALTWLNDNELMELLPSALLKKYNLGSISDALNYVHKPPVDADVKQLQLGEHPAQRRLAFEELLAHQLSLSRLRSLNKKKKSHALQSSQRLQHILLNHLSFTLTKAQEKVLSEIYTDLMQPHPMMRLLQGDVGCGKTIVAALALLQAIELGYQVALMAPTEILAEQHEQNFKSWFTPLGIHVSLLLGSQSVKEKREQLSNLADGKIQLMIGTHALFQKDVVFKNLAFIVIDEQHRFGVDQRMALQYKGKYAEYYPHQLLMTATPIPRTLTMMAYADLDCSVIDELPPNRKPIKTVLVSTKRRSDIIERVRENCIQGHQVYWVCTLIEESEVLQCQAAAKTAEELRSIFTDVRVGLVHGRMSHSEKESIMKEFYAGTVNLLVATTVIEVGVNVPNASLMIIENPERLGLAQLHQLRGRVGRGNTASFCVLLYQAPLTSQAEQRLQVMRDSQDGFCIAQKDLELRGPGEVLGTRQSGAMCFRVANLLRDQSMIASVRALGNELLCDYAEWVDPLVDRWLGAQLHYFQQA